GEGRGEGIEGRARVLCDEHGKRDCKLELLTHSGQLQVQLILDVGSCKALAAALLDTVDKIGLQNLAIANGDYCPCCAGMLPDYRTDRIKVGNDWMHHAKDHTRRWLKCLKPPQPTGPIIPGN